MIEKLSDEARALALADLPQWTAVSDPNGMTRRFTFVDFAAAEPPPITLPDCVPRTRYLR